jgi:hypothetical protein
VWHLFLDDVDVNQSIVFSSGNPVWQTNYYAFTATMATHKIGLRAYTPTFNGGGSAAIDNFMISESKPTGIENNTTEDISVFPNPAASELIVRSSDFGDNSELTIYNVFGELILRQQTTNIKQQTVDVSQLASGLYFAEVLLTNGTLKRIRFIKE